MEKKSYEKKCPKCGKVISSLSKEQFEYNYKQHADSHKRKEGKQK